MTTDELIKALKWVARVTTYCDTHMVNCHECEFHGFCTDPNSDESIGQQSEWFTQAADELARLAKENAELREAQRWITLSHKRPNESDGNLVLCRFADDAIETFYVDSFDSWNKGHKKRGDAITHWMPLPKPPKKG